MAHTGPGFVIQPDDQLSDEGYASSTTSSYVTSIASDIRKGIEENGRTCPAYGKNADGLPVDDSEQDRGDLQLCKFTLCLNGKLHLAPIAELPRGFWISAPAQVFGRLMLQKNIHQRRSSELISLLFCHFGCRRTVNLR